MRRKRPIEQVVEQVKATVDIHEVQELEQVASEKMVRCVRNVKRDAMPQARPSRKVVPPPSTAAPTSSSPSSNPLYEPDDEVERGEGKDVASNSEEAQEGEDQIEEGPVLGDVLGDELQDAQSDDESFEILGGVDKSGPAKALVTQDKGKGVEIEPASRVTRLKRPSDSRTLQT